MTGAGELRVGYPQIVQAAPDAPTCPAATVLCDLLDTWREAGLTDREIVAYVRLVHPGMLAGRFLNAGR